MNERIKELAIQVQRTEMPGVLFAHPEFVEKFAELIVQEYSYDVMNLHGASPERVAMAAKHWGVEL
jgi:hypothetical protein